MLHEVIVQKLGVFDQIFQARNGEEAWGHLQNEQLFSASVSVLLDLNMPIMNGWELLELIHTKLTYIPSVVIITSSVNQSDKETAQSFPCITAYIEKPITKDVISNLEKNGCFAS